MSLGHSPTLRRTREWAQIRGMRKTLPTQLALIELPPSPRRADDRARREAQAAVNAMHCRALLAELDRVAKATADERAERLMHLYEAAERAHVEGGERRDATVSGSRPTAGALAAGN